VGSMETLVYHALAACAIADWAMAWAMAPDPALAPLQTAAPRLPSPQIALDLRPGRSIYCVTS